VSKSADARQDLALANNIVANEGVLDAFGHVSMRHPDNPNRYLLSCSRAPELVTASDLIEYDLDSRPLREPGVSQYSERVIHGEIYKARPDVMAVCHHHAPAFMPLLATRTDYRPLYALACVAGDRPPFWDQRDEFGDTDLLVVTPAQGGSLARALGQHWMVLMNRHGVTVAGESVRDCVFRAVTSARNADVQVRAMALGTLEEFSPGEIERCSRISSRTTGLDRAWEYWSMRVAKVVHAAAAPKKVAAKRSAARKGGRAKLRTSRRTSGRASGRR
jgi:HCOMODA/2-hydroxy-3-carboxy-muconic semialdehyde decarboxylase